MWVFLRLGLALALVTGAWAALPASSSPEPPVDIAALQAGDAAAYEMVLSGGWVYGDTPAEAPTPGPRFEVLPPDLVTRADGIRVHAFPVLSQAPATTLLPAAAGQPTWHTWQGVQWLDGERVATQSTGRAEAAIALGARGSDDTLWTYPPPGARDCLLGAPQPHGCDLPYLRLALGPAAVEDLGVERVGHAPARHLHADDGTTSLDWWYAQDIPVPVAFEATAPGAPGLPPRSVRLELRGYLEGMGASEPLASSFGAARLDWAPRQPWGPDDSGAAAPLLLSRAYNAALTDPSFPDLRDWLRRHDGYVFMAEPSDDGERWKVHFSDGRTGFSLSAHLVEPPLPSLPARIELQRIEPSSLAPAAPSIGRAPPTMPNVESMAARWDDHAAGLRHAGADLWAFAILEGEVHYAVGRADELRWAIDAVEIGLGETRQSAAVLELDGQGRARSFRAPAAVDVAPARSPPYAPASLPYIEPFTAPAATVGFAAAAGLVLLMPKIVVTLFTRFRPGELLEHPLRATIMDAVRAEPGLHFRALCDRLGQNPGRVRHHVRKLVEGGHLVARAAPGYTCYFVREGTSRMLLDAGPLMRSDGARSLVGCLAQRPGSNAKDLAGLAGLSPATTTYHLKRLQAVGLVEAQREGRCLRLHLTPGGREVAGALG